jgi:hypothetical protein
MCRLLGRCVWRVLPVLPMALASCAVGADRGRWSVAWKLPIPCDSGHFHFIEAQGRYLAVCGPAGGVWMVDKATGALAWRANVAYACGSVKVLCLGDRALIFSGMQNEAALLRMPSGATIWRRLPPPFFDWKGVWPLTGPEGGSGNAGPDSQSNRFLFLATEASNRPRQSRLDVMEADGSVRLVTDMEPQWVAYLGGNEAYLIRSGHVRALDLATGHSALRLRYAIGERVYCVFPDGPRICVAGSSGIYGIDPAQGRLLWEVPREDLAWLDEPMWEFVLEPVLAGNCLAIADRDGLTLVDTVTGALSRVTGMRPLLWARPVVAGQWVYVLAKGNGSRSSRLWRVDRHSGTKQVIASVKGRLADDPRPVQADPDAAYITLVDRRERPHVMKLVPSE